MCTITLPRNRVNAGNNVDILPGVPAAPASPPDAQALPQLLAELLIQLLQPLIPNS